MLKLEKGLNLKDFSTFRIGGAVEGFCRIKNEEDLQEFLTLARKEQKPFFVLGGGSNVLFSDQFWPGWVAKIENNRKLERKGNKIVCGAGGSLTNLVKLAKDNDLSGLEWATGIPGTVGGAIRGNAGAFGREMKDCVEEITVFDLAKNPIEKQVFNKTACQFDYRQSIFKKNKNLLVWEAVVFLSSGEKVAIEKQMDEILEKRQNKQPALGQFPSLGSIFKNPQAPEEVVALFEKEKNTQAKEGKVPAGWLIEKCGLKGKMIGGAQISPQQANFIVNLGDASAKDVFSLIALAKEKVRNTFGVELKEEIEIFE